MRINVPHHTTKAKARQIIEKRVKNAEKDYGHLATDFSCDWKADVLCVQVKAKGITAKGTLEITDKDVIIDGKLPLIALPFEKKIRAAVEKEAESMFA